MANLAPLEVVLTLNGEQFSGQLAAAQEQAKAFSDSVGKSSQKLEQKLGKIGTGMKELGGNLVSIGGAIDLVSVGTIAASSKMAADFQTQMQNIAGNTNMTTQQLNYMKQSVLELGKQSGASFNDLGQGFMHITNLGYSGADATKILQAAMQSAVATGANVSDVANSLGQVMKDFGMNANQAQEAINILHTAAAKGNMTLEEMVTAFGQTAGEAANFGMQLPDVAAALSALTRHGVDATEAGTQLKNMLLKIAAPSSQSYAAIQALSQVTGVDLTHDFTQAGLASKGLSGVLADIGKATNGNIGQMMQMATGVNLTKKQIELMTRASNGQIAALQQLDPNIRGLYGMFVLLNNGAKDYKDTLAAMGQASKDNIVGQLYTQQLQNTNQQLQILERNLQAAAITLGNVFLPMINQAVQKILPFVEKLTSWVSKNQQNAATILLVASAIGTFLIAAGSLLIVLGSIASSISNIIELNNTLGATKFLSGIIDSVPDLISSALGVSKAWITGASESIAAWLQYQIEIISQYVLIAASAVKNAAVTVASWVASAVKSAASWVVTQVETVAGFVMTSASAIKEAGTTAVAWIVAAHQSEDGFIGSLLKIVGQFIYTSAEAIVNAAIASGAWIASSVKSVGAWIVATPEMIAQFALSSTSAIKQALITSTAWIASSAEAVLAWVLSSPKIIAEFVATSVSAVFNSGVAGASWVGAALKTSIGWVAASVKTIASFVAMGVSAVAQGTIASIAFVGTTIKIIALTVATEAAKTATVLWTGVQWLLNAALTANPVGLVIIGIAALIAIIVLMVTHWQQTVQILNTAWNAIKVGFNDVLNFVKDNWYYLPLIFMGPLAIVVALVLSHFNQVRNIIGNVVGIAWSWGSDMIQNFINGINSKIGQLKGSVAQVGNAIKSFLHFSKPDTGPLADADKWMPDMVDLMSRGLRMNLPKLQMAINGALAGTGANSTAYSYNQVNNVNINGGSNSWQQRQDMSRTLQSLSYQSQFM